MAITGKAHGSKVASGKTKALQASAGGDIGQESRVEELRQMVAAGRYEVHPFKLALKIMVRAMKR